MLRLRIADTLLELVSSYSILYSQGKSKPLSLIFDTALDEHEQVIPVELSLKMEKMLTAVDEGTVDEHKSKELKLPANRHSKKLEILATKSNH